MFRTPSTTDVGDGNELAKPRNLYYSTQRVHIVGLSPRSGTTLMHELMAACFEFDGVSVHETSIFTALEGNPRVACTKSPRELRFVMDIGPLPGLWCICMIRDPRDVVVSMHRVRPGRYYTDYSLFQANLRLLRKRARRYPNLITVRYEDLVSSPDRIQNLIEKQIPFLQKKANFSDFHKVASASSAAIDALGGMRAVDTSSIGNWKRHLPRIRAQVSHFDSMAAALIELGYERDDEWLGLLEGISPDSQANDPPRSLPLRLRDWIKTRRKVLLARRGILKRVPARG